MAKLKIEFEENGSLKLTLDFLGHTYTQEITRLEDGNLFYRDDLESLIDGEVGDYLEDIIGEDNASELLVRLAGVEDNDVIQLSDIVAALTECEQRIKAEAKP